MELDAIDEPEICDTDLRQTVQFDAISELRSCRFSSP